MQKKGVFHVRNRHQGHCDFESPMGVSPELRRFASGNRRGELSIDFTDPGGVKALNRAILCQQYGVRGWAWRALPMSQGQKKSRVLAWTFQ
jgi:23S rRNA (adenine1618-N6)-methyltransferase